MAGKYKLRTNASLTEKFRYTLCSPYDGLPVLLPATKPYCKVSVYFRKMVKNVDTDFFFVILYKPT